MPWNPSPEVAALRDAAKKCGLDRAVLFFTRKDGKFGYLSYGETRKKCDEAKRLADGTWDAFQGELEFLIADEAIAKSLGD